MFAVCLCLELCSALKIKVRFAAQVSRNASLSYDVDINLREPQRLDRKRTLLPKPFG